jgi:hypothetical protein
MQQAARTLHQGCCCDAVQLMGHRSIPRARHAALRAAAVTAAPQAAGSAATSSGHGDPTPGLRLFLDSADIRQWRRFVPTGAHQQPKGAEARAAALSRTNPRPCPAPLWRRAQRPAPPPFARPAGALYGVTTNPAILEKDGVPCTLEAAAGLAREVSAGACPPI